MKKIKVGAMVEYHPGTATPSFLPNNMQFAPALVLQVFDHARVNLIVFMPTEPNTWPIVTAWSIDNEMTVTDGRPYWDFIETPDEPLDLN